MHSASLIVASVLLGTASAFTVSITLPEECSDFVLAPLTPTLLVYLQPFGNALSSPRMPADYGFDPLGVGKADLHVFSATDRANQIVERKRALSLGLPLVMGPIDRDPAIVLKDYRDSEIRHGRLAMLAALAYPVQELLGPALARTANQVFGAPGLADLLAETGGRSPSLLNGGLAFGHVVPVFLVVAFGLIGAVDLKSMDLRDELGPDEFVAGDFGFDPLNLMKGATAEAQFDMQAKEINNGRLAMLAITAYAVEEFFGGKPIIELTPQFFTPAFFTAPWLTSLFDHSFSVASAAQRISGDEVSRFFEVVSN